MADASQEVTITEKDLPLHCPMPDAPLWARHPRVFLDVARQGEARCPATGERYRLTGERLERLES